MSINKESMTIEEKFHQEMINIYKKAKAEAHYTATRFFHMVDSEGGLATAKKLIMRDDDSAGFASLWERNRLDLTVEALVIREEFRSLFSEEEIEKCKKKLRNHGFKTL